jgi:hypothetical protein
MEGTCCYTQCLWYAAVSLAGRLSVILTYKGRAKSRVMVRADVVDSVQQKREESRVMDQTGDHGHQHQAIQEILLGDLLISASW